jgi:hypothetical protein
MADIFAYEATGPGSDLFGVIDLTTGVFTSVGAMGQTLAKLGSYGGVIYGGAYHGNTLYSVNTSTGALTAIGTGNVDYADFGSTTSELYAFGLNGDLYSSIQQMVLLPTLDQRAFRSAARSWECRQVQAHII